MRCRFWEAATGRLIWATPPWYRMPLFSPDGRHVAMVYGADVHLVSLDSGKVVRTFDGHRREITWIGFPRGGRRLVTVSNDRTIRVWHVGLGWELRKIELGRVGVQALSTVAISGDGKLLALVTAYSSVSLYDLDSGRSVRTLKTPSPAWVTSLAFTGDDGRTLCGRLHDSKTLFWNVRDGRICDGVAPTSRPGVFAVSPDGRTVAYASGGRIRLEDVRTGKETPASARLPRCGSVPEMMALAGGSGAKTLITAASDGVWRWDVSTGRDRVILAAAGGGGGKWAAVSGDGRLAASLGGRGVVGVYDIATGKRIALIEGGVEKITAAAFSGDGRMLVTGSRESIALWNLPAGTRAGAITLDKNKKKCVGFGSLELSGDGKTVAAVVIRANPRLRGDRRLKGPREASHALPMEVRGIEIFDVGRGECRGRIGGYLFALSPDSRTLAKPAYKCIELWDLGTLKKTGTLKCGEAMLSGMMGAAMRLRFSPDGRKLARAIIMQKRIGKRRVGEYGCVELLDLAGGASRILKVDDIAAAPVIAFSADSGTLATAGASGAIVLWDTSKP